MTTAFVFDGDFDLLPFRAGVLYGAVPAYPEPGAFELAVSRVFGDPDEPAAHWQVEAIRWRIANLGRPLNEGLKAIAQATAARLYKRAVEST